MFFKIRAIYKKSRDGLLGCLNRWCVRYYNTYWEGTMGREKLRKQCQECPAKEGEKEAQQCDGEVVDSSHCDVHIGIRVVGVLRRVVKEGRL